MGAPKEKPTPVAKPEPVVHRVLYVNGQPVLSFAEGDKNADEDFAAYRLEALNNARRAAAQRPVFEEKLECEGQEVSR